MEDLSYAINELKRVIEVCETNAPINEANGNLDQAKLERQIASSCKAAIEILQ